LSKKPKRSVGSAREKKKGEENREETWLVTNTMTHDGAVWTGGLADQWQFGLSKYGMSASF
jgi:hypothetical protein